ncbi:MAG: DUF2163 domain-containing protein [Silicimonas sp.]|nr:DUF2163 domain-containing protein [Silicimonas sp.]NND21916.1 DUF2163 domain-containing protein [Silicimonas sp.]NNL71736.1 DUF2163 domain-containing protein [Silicimonas sp.]
MSAALQAHLKSGVTTICRAWAVTRRDGLVLGFTDHDRDLSFDGVDFRASTGLTARALEQSTGLAVDNAEAVGALSDAAIREADIAAGLYDNAEVRSWLVNWADVDARKLTFRGSIGEIERQGPGFRAELRGLAEALNQPNAKVYQTPCAAVLGDARCGVDTALPGVSLEAGIVAIAGGDTLTFAAAPAFPLGWFARGRATVLTGASAGAVGLVKRDRDVSGQRVIDLWEVLGAGLGEGDLVRLEPGCDKRLATCRDKFDNLLNFRGFPDIPGEDWLVAYPVRSGANDGGSLR